MRQKQHCQSVATDSNVLSYTIKRLRFNLFRFLSSVVLIFFWLAWGGLDYFGQWLGTYSSDWTLLLVVMMVSYFTSVILDYYYVFHIEQEHGFNQMTLSLFLKDLLKKTVLLLFTIVPLMLITLWLTKLAGMYWWLVLWAVCVFALIVYSKVSDVIAKLFNTFTPIKNVELKKRAEELSEKNSVTLEEIFVVDQSLRSSHSNAYFSGVGKNKRIVLDDTLLEQLSVDEIIAVLAHELGHYKLNHELKIYSVIATVLFLAIAAFAWLYESSIIYALNSISPIIVFYILWPVISFVIQPVLLYFTRSFEYDADTFAIDNITPEFLQSALKKLSDNNKMIPSSDFLYRIFYESHPTISKRIDRLKETKL